MTKAKKFSSLEFKPGDLIVFNKFVGVLPTKVKLKDHLFLALVLDDAPLIMLVCLTSDLEIVRFNIFDDDEFVVISRICDAL